MATNAAVLRGEPSAINTIHRLCLSLTTTVLCGTCHVCMFANIVKFLLLADINLLKKVDCTCGRAIRLRCPTLQFNSRSPTVAIWIQL